MPKHNDIVDLSKRISAYKADNAKPKYANNDNFSASRVCIELVSAVIAGIIIGAVLDNLLKTKLIFKIICLILSCIAGFYSICKLARKR